MSKKLVSVCINAYNAEKYILKTIESVINQSYTNLQIIVVDDCSTDNTYNLVKSIDDKRIELYKTDFNCHISNACNETFKHIRGEYVAHIDSDDLWEVDKIEKQVEFLEKNAEYGACFTHAEIINANGDRADESQDFLREIYTFENRAQHEFFRFFYDNSNRLSHPSSLIRSEFIHKTGNHDTSLLYLHDFDYWVRLLTQCQIYIIEEPLTKIRRHTQNNSDMTPEKWVALNNELARVLYNSINLCPDDLFLKAFEDKLRIKGNHTHDEVEIEKAFILLEGTPAYKNNPILGINKFAELFKQEKYIKLAKSKFNFTTKDLYKLQCTPCYFDINDKTHLVNSLENANLEISNQKEYISTLEKHNEDLKKHNDSLNENNQNQGVYINSLESQIQAVTTQLAEAQNDYHKLKSNFFVRCILFVKKIFKSE